MEKKSRSVENTWNEFFELLELVETNAEDNVAKNFQIPKSLMKLMKEDKAMIEEKTDSYLSMRDFMIILLCKGGNYSYNKNREKNDKFYRAKNGNNLYNYYKQKEKEKEKEKE